MLLTYREVTGNSVAAVRKFSKEKDPNRKTFEIIEKHLRKSTNKCQLTKIEEIIMSLRSDVSSTSVRRTFTRFLSQGYNDFLLSS